MTPAFLGITNLKNRQKINTHTDDQPTRSF